MDLMRKFGVLVFASRLKRLSERLNSDITTLYHQQGIDFNNSWFLVGLMLSKHNSMTVAHMAKLLGVPRTAINQMAAAMAVHGLVTIQSDPCDTGRSLSLTYKGREAVAELEEVWNAVGESIRELIASTGQDLLEAISRIEVELKKRSMFARVIDRLPETRSEHARSH